MAPLRLHANLLFYGLDEGTWSDPPTSPVPSPAAAAGGSDACISNLSASAVSCGDWPCSGTWAESAAPAAQEVWRPQQQQHGLAQSSTGLETIKAVWGCGGDGGTLSAFGLNTDAINAPFDGTGVFDTNFNADLFTNNIGATAVNTAAIGGGGAVFATEPSTDEGSEPKGSESDSLPDSNEGYLVPTARSQQRQATNGGSQPPALLSYLPPPAATMCGVPTAAPVVSSHPTLQGPGGPNGAAATTAYSPYMPPGSFLTAHSASAGCGTNGVASGTVATHGFGGGEAGPFSYDAVASTFSTAAATATAVARPAGLATATPSTNPGPDGVPSIGSYAHLSGQCSRCCFHPKGRCANGFSCQFCHFDHDKRPRNGKKKRYRRQADGTLIEGGDD